jgi:hypothetical protein
VFLDALAIVPYVEGQPWAGYAQFCESFLNPLLLAAHGCESWQATYRGRIRGIATREVARQLGVWGALRSGAFLHVIVNSQSAMRSGAAASGRAPKSSKAGLDLMLASLTRCIRKLSGPRARGANWGGYEAVNSYSGEQRAAKHAAVAEFVQRIRPRLLVDVGCNAGEYSATALDAGAASVVGLERDGPAVDRAVTRADSLGDRFLPLQIDIQNMSPALGWNLGERLALRDRLQPDSLLCLALIHHLVLGEGVPLELAVPGIVSWAPRGIIEFVPREDPMAQRIAGPPERLTHRYDLATFLSILAQTATVIRQTILADDGRVLVEYQR